MFVAADDTVRSPVWLAPLDGRSPPRRLVRSNALQVFSGADGEVAYAAREQERNFANAVLLYPTDGGSPRLLCGTCSPAPSFERGPWPMHMKWSPDGKFVYLALYGFPYAIPLRRGQVLPPLPARGLQSDQEVAAMPGARRIPQEGAFVGPDPSRYAFTKVAIQRNIYRVPVP